MADNSGLKVGLGVSALGGASMYAASKIVNKATKSAVNRCRSDIALGRQGIKAGLEAISLTNNSGIADMAKNVVIFSKKQLINNSYKRAQEMFKSRKEFKSINNLRTFGLAIPFYLACGAIVDFANRKQRANNSPNATTKNGNEYTKVNMGKKLGAFLGIATEVACAALNKKDLAKVQKLTPNKTITAASTLFIGAIGGFILGAISDKISNKKAAKEADKAMA